MKGNGPWKGRKVVVTGGLGFIGSNLVIRLRGLGAAVTIVDPCVPGCGGRPENVVDVVSEVRILPVGIEEMDAHREVLIEADVVFNLAGEISHAASMRDPLRDLEINTTAQLKFLRLLAECSPGIRVVYALDTAGMRAAANTAGSRGSSDQPKRFQRDSQAGGGTVPFTLCALGTAGFDRSAADEHVWTEAGAGRSRTGFLTVFLRRALEGEVMEVFGDGMQLRDPIFVDDAVDAFLNAGATPDPPFRLFNVCGPEALTLLDIARIVQAEAGCRREVKLRPFPEEHWKFDIGSFAGDATRIRASLGWSPKVEFPEGIRMTLNHFRHALLAQR